MAIQTINTGTSPNAGNGDSVRTAFTKANANFIELYSLTNVLSANMLNVGKTEYFLSNIEAGEYFVDPTDDVILVGGNNVNDLRIILPVTGMENGKRFTIKKAESSTSRIVTIYADPTTIDGEGIIQFNDDHGYITVVWDTHVGNGVGQYFTVAESSVASAVSETDPVFGASAAAAITATNITNWNTAYVWGDHSTAGYLTTVTTVNLSSVTQSILPAADLTYDLGSTSSQWRSLYVGTSTIYIGGTALSILDGNITLNGTSVTVGVSSLTNGIHSFTLGTDGSLNFPDNTVQSSAFTGTVVYNNITDKPALLVNSTAPLTSKGRAGDTTGLTSVTSSSIFYCISNYVALPNSATVNVSGGNGVDSGIAVTLFTVPQVGWTIEYNGQSSTINQITPQGGWYVVFWDTPISLNIGDTFTYGPDTLPNIWVKQNWTTTGNW